MNLQALLDYILYTANKAQVGGTIAPREYNMLLSACNILLLKKKIGLPEEYQPGAPFSRQQFESGQSNTDSLSPFKVYMGVAGTMPLSIDSNGYAPVPPDYFYHSALSYLYIPTGCDPVPEPRQINIVTDGEWDDLIGNAIKSPTLRYPIANYQAGFIRFAPINLQRAQYIYIRYPNTPVYDYYISADEEEVFLPAGTSHLLAVGETGSQGQVTGTTVNSLTVEPEWNETGKLEIASMILERMGVNMRDMAVIQEANKQIQAGV